VSTDDASLGRSGKVAEVFSMLRSPVLHDEVTLTLRVDVADASARIFQLSEAFVSDTFRLRFILTSERRRPPLPADGYARPVSALPIFPDFRNFSS
jgi:hypothetical protein